MGAAQRWAWDSVAGTLADAGVGDQFLTETCPHGSEECARDDGLSCWQCFVEGGEQADE